MKTYILLEDIEIYAYHGLSGQENRVGNRFVINLKITSDVSRACLSDDIAHTLNYATVYDIIKKEMETPSRLLEHAGGRVVRQLKARFGQIERIELKISKMNPPVGGQVKAASLVLVEDWKDK